MITLIIFLLVLSVLVFVHEFGHFITAKRAGLRVDEFGFGFPPRVVGIQRVNGRRKIIWGSPKGFNVREGNTLYSINALPFGGFVKIKGESGEGVNERDSFASRDALTRVWIIAAGVLMNAVLAVVLIAGGLTVGFPQTVGDGVSRFAKVSDPHIQILGVLPASPAAQAGISGGERILAGNGQAFPNAQAFQTFIAEFLGKPVRLEIGQKDAMRAVEVTPIILEKTGRPGIGISIMEVAQVRYPVWVAIPKAVEVTFVLAKTIVVTIVQLIYDGLTGKPVTAELAGPVGIAVLTGQAAREGLVNLLQFMAILSINLAILNILPFPALDGGRILFIALEKVLRRKVASKVEGWIHGVGFALLIVLVLFVTYRDLGRYGGRITEFFKGLFIN